MYDQSLIEFCKQVKPIKLAVTKSPTELEFKSKIIDATFFLNSIPNIKLSTRYYCILNNITEIPKCKSCNNPTTPNKKDQNLGFTQYCSPECSRKSKTVNNEILSKLSDKEWLYNQRITLEKSIELIANELNCSITPIIKYIKLHDIPDVKYNESNTKALVYLKDKEWLYNQHVILRKTCEQIATEINSSKATISLYLNKHKIIANEPNSYDRPEHKVTKPILEIKDFIRTFYDGEIKLNVRSIISPYELDIYLPENN